MSQKNPTKTEMAARLKLQETPTFQVRVFMAWPKQTMSIPLEVTPERIKIKEWTSLLRESGTLRIHRKRKRKKAPATSPMEILWVKGLKSWKKVRNP